MYVGCKNLRYGRDENFVISDVLMNICISCASLEQTHNLEFCLIINPYGLVALSSCPLSNKHGFAGLVIPFYSPGASGDLVAIKRNAP